MMLHIDIDCFFVSAHRINNPKYANIPLAVGGRSNLSIFETKNEKRHLSKIGGAFTSSILSSYDNKSFEDYFVDPDGKVRGILTTSSYEARKFGVKTAMAVSEALRYCPHLTVLPPNYPLYHELSHKLKQYLQTQAPSIEQFSIDEFFVDVSGWINDDDILEYAKTLKQNIWSLIQLPVTIGIAKTKWIAKLATNDAKPDGIKLVLPHEVDEFIQDKSIDDFPGIGKGYSEKLQRYGIHTLGDIKQRKELFERWGKSGIQLYNRICGIDNESISLEKSKKSIGLGRTFDPEQNRSEIQRRITILCRHLSFLALKGGHKPLTYGLKIRYQYGQKVKDYTNTNRLFNEAYLKQQMIELFHKIDIHPKHAIIQLNLTLSNFEENKHSTLDIFNYESDSKQFELSLKLQKLRDKFGIDIIKSGSELK